MNKKLIKGIVLMLIVIGLFSGCVEKDIKENPDVDDIRFVFNNLSKDFDWVYFGNGSLAGAIVNDIPYFNNFDNSSFVDIEYIRNTKS